MFTREECVEEGQVCSVEGGSAQWSNRQVHLVMQVHVVLERLPEIMKEVGIRLRSRIKINKCVSDRTLNSLSSRHKSWKKGMTDVLYHNKMLHSKDSWRWGFCSAVA